MTTEEMASRLGYKIISSKDKALVENLTGVYTCDLLSHAMAKVKRGDLWITVHTNLNVVAVASLTEAACVLIPENIEIGQQTIERAESEGVVILSSPDSASKVCYEILSILDDLS